MTGSPKKHPRWKQASTGDVCFRAGNSQSSRSALSAVTTNTSEFSSVIPALFRQYAASMLRRSLTGFTSHQEQVVAPELLVAPQPSLPTQPRSLSLPHHYSLHTNRMLQLCNTLLLSSYSRYLCGGCGGGDHTRHTFDSIHCTWACNSSHRFCTEQRDRSCSNHRCCSNWFSDDNMTCAPPLLRQHLPQLKRVQWQTP